MIGGADESWRLLSMTALGKSKRPAERTPGSITFPFWSCFLFDCEKALTYFQNVESDAPLPSVEDGSSSPEKLGARFSEPTVRSWLQAGSLDDYDELLKGLVAEEPDNV